MKRYFIKGLLVSGLVFGSASSFAQDKDAENADKKDKKDVQQIIITRKGDADEKTVIEIKGDKVTVNGKDVSNSDDVKVRLSKIRDITAYRTNGVAGPGWNFNINDDKNALSLFTEDVNRAMLGVVTEEDAKGARISSISKESPAEKAGLKEGDIITKIDEQKVEKTGDVISAIRKHKPGEKTTITVLRDNKEQKITAELEKWKGIKMDADKFKLDAENFRIMAPDVWNNVPNPPGPFRVNGAPKLGLSVQDTEDGKGVKVLDVDEDSNADKAGIKENDIITHINDEAVNSTDEVTRKVRDSREKGSVNFKLLRNGKTQNIEVKIPRRLKSADL